MYNSSVHSPFWADTSSIVTSSRTVLMFVLDMLCLHNQFLAVFHSSHGTQL